VTLLEFTEQPLTASRIRPARFYWLYHHRSLLSDYVLIVREWFETGDWEDESALSIYVVQEVSHVDHGRPGAVFVLVRANPLPALFKLYDDTGAAERLYSCYVPHPIGDRSSPGECDCKGFRTFARCTHLDALRDAMRLTWASYTQSVTQSVSQSVAQNSEPSGIDEWADPQLQSLLLDDKP
jgi:hypothetical protein